MLGVTEDHDNLYDSPYIRPITIDKTYYIYD